MWVWTTLKGILRRNRRDFISLGLLIVGLLLFFAVFWDSFTWPYFWGPVVADARDAPQQGIAEGYNTFNTVGYALIMVAALYYIYKMLKKLNVPVNTRFILALSPWIFLGGSLRSLEDTGLFGEPTSYLFIAPVIYFTLGLSAIFVLLYGVYVERRHGNVGGGLARIMLALAVMNIVYAVYYYVQQGQLAYDASPGVLAGCSLLALLFAGGYAKYKGGVNHRLVLFTVGGAVAFYSIYLILAWTSGSAWGPYTAINDGELFIIPVLAFAATGTTYFIFKTLKDKWNTATYVMPINVLLFFGHFLDAAATYRGIDGYGYFEKHVLPSFLIGLTGTALVMFPLKAVVVILAIWMIDILFRKELEDDPRLVGLVKMAIFVLGVSPGIRDMLRLAMGV